MNEIESAGNRINLGALWQVLQELEAGSLEPERRDALMDLLNRSPAAQSIYLEYFELAAILKSAAAIHAEQGNLPLAGQSRLSSRVFRRSLLAAAALLILAALVASLVMVNAPAAPRLTAAVAADTQWTVDDVVMDSTTENQTVSAGSTVQVWSGTVRLRFASGASLVLQGPALATFSKLEAPVLQRGWLWIDSNNSGQPFEVTTPELRVRDIGTRFGVRVPDQGPAEVHLIEGKIEVFAKATQVKLVTLEPDQRGYAIAATGEPNGLALARDPFPSLANLLAEPANYPTTVRSQNPSGYWRMQEADAEPLANEIPDSPIGRHFRTVTMAAPGPGPADSFPGLGEDNRAASFPGTPGRQHVSLGTTPIHTGLLYHEEFTGQGPLHGSTPDSTYRGANWIAAPMFEANGNVNAATKGPGSATLALTPNDGTVYTLDASLRGVTGNEDWVALGFASAQSAAGTIQTRFINGAVVGRAWMIIKGNASGIPQPTGSGNNNAFLGTTGSNGGIADGQALSSFATGSIADLDLRIILDTTGGPGTWTATWLAKRPSEEHYLTVRATENLLNEDIRSVGLAVARGGTSGTIKSFSLRSDHQPSSRPDPPLVVEPARISRKEGSLSLWVHREPGGERRETLWTAGEHPEDSAIHAHLTADGRAAFFMENGRYDVLLTSEDSIADGHWHHLAASWSAAVVELFLDGHRIATDNDFRGMQQGILPELRVGTAPAGTDSAPFAGRIDEIALWDRALTPAEVLHQFRSAQGK